MRYLVIAALLFAATHTGLANTLWDYNAVDANGSATHPLVGAATVPANRVTFTALVIAGALEAGDPFNPDFPYYQIFLQDPNSDRGGIAAFASPHAQYIWENYPLIPSGHLVEISGYMMDRFGKVLVNNRHSAVADVMWSMTDLGYVGLPQPQTIPSIAEAFEFDPTRQTGGELYQMRWVHLRDAFVSDGSWGSGQTLTIADSSGAEILMDLSRTGDFGSGSIPTGPFDVIAIFNQEDPTAPFTDGYRLFVKTQQDIVIRGDFNGDGVLSGLDIPGFKQALADPAGWDSAHPGRYANIIGDFSADGVFSGLDIPGFKAALAGAAVAVPEPGTMALVVLGALAAFRRRMN